MNTLELEAYKAALAREVLNINNQEVLDTIKDIIQRSGNLTNAPYQIGVKEARKQLQDSEKRFDEGEYVSEEEMAIRQLGQQVFVECPDVLPVIERSDVG
uniref:hypothetical protein n=1 Tax=Bacteroides cellulosilyticus TaxID=246787 RepID=UPI0032EC3B12